MKNFNEKYTIRDFIDKNKWANVYEGINNQTNEKVILNILINLEKNEENMVDFKEEINNFKSMDKSNLIAINDMSSYVNKDKTYYYIESEYFEGLTLKELKESTELDETKSLEIIREVIKGIKEFNDREINYGDLKEENIIINEEGIVKVDVLSFINKYEGYLNCDEIKGEGFDYYEDIYTIGILLCQLITGKSTFNPKENNEDLDVDLIDILIKSTNTKHISKHKYKNLDDFLYEVTSYIEYGEIKHKNIVNFEKIKYPQINSKTKKYIGLVLSMIVVITGIAFGGKYILNSMNKEKNKNPVTKVSEEKEDKEKEENITSKDNTDNLINNSSYSTNSNKENTDTNKEEEKTKEENTNKEKEEEPEKENNKNQEGQEEQEEQEESEKEEEQPSKEETEEPENPEKEEPEEETPSEEETENPEDENANQSGDNQDNQEEASQKQTEDISNE